MQRDTLDRILTTAFGATVVAATAAISQDYPSIIVFVGISIFLAVAAKLYKFDYLHPAIAYLLPWSTILIFSVIPISRYARPMELPTYWLLLATTFAWLFGCVSAAPPPISVRTRAVGVRPTADGPEFRTNYRLIIALGFVFLYAFAALNVALAGYVPILSLLTTGDSRYLEFGVPSVYGMFLAYANAMGCIALYVYLRSHRRVYLYLFLSIFIMHVALVTRQNLITLMVEAFVIRSLSIKRLSRITVIWSVVIAISIFSVLGSVRSGDVKEIFGVQEQFLWIPAGVIWVYAYSYFNALTIDNVVAFSGAPYFDGFMFQTLLPSVLRPESNHEKFIEVASAAAETYIYPVYIDIGKGVILWTGLLGAITARSYKKALRSRRFVDVATYGCLFFCALLSFFTDCWLYLPVIFQIVFFRLFHVLLFNRKFETLSTMAAG